MVSTPFVPVPPRQYGGTELVVAELIDGLVDRGVEVTLFAAGDSQGGYRRACPVRSWFKDSTWPPSVFKELEHTSFALGELLAGHGEHDLVHAHCPTFLPLSQHLGLPVVYTLHHPYDAELCRLYAGFPRVTYVSISARQQQLCGPFARGAVVHHGIGPERYRLGRVCPDTVAFLGRLSRVKAPHRAIDVAAAAGLRIRVGGRPHEEDAGYFRAELQQRLGAPHVEYLGEIGHEPKVELLSTSRALLFPIEWEEPFGLVMIEAMLCGCPVIAYARGSAPEVIDEGITGFFARDEEHMVKLLEGPARPEVFDRKRCREHAVRRFSAARMVDDYLRVYRAAHLQALRGLKAEAEEALQPHA
ncbi:MAG: glycosyltransferase family 4 protein [Myxococcales bacterium]